MPPEGLEPAIPASDRPQMLALHRAATEIGINMTHISLSTQNRRIV
jgi:hypothetical protein